jgi:hypothetical protein
MLRIAVKKQQFRVIRMARHDRMCLKLSEFAGERDMRRWRNILIAKKEYFVFQQQPSDLAKKIVVLNSAFDRDI